jgi:hypothetical protein
VPNRIFEKSESEGRNLKREIAPSLLSDPAGTAHVAERP